MSMQFTQGSNLHQTYFATLDDVVIISVGSLFCCLHKMYYCSCKTKPLYSSRGLQTTEGLVQSSRRPHRL